MAITQNAVRVNTVAGNVRMRVLRMTEDTGGNASLEVGGGGIRFARAQGVDTADTNVGISRESITNTIDKNGVKGQIMFDGVAAASYDTVVIGTG